MRKIILISILSFASSCVNNNNIQNSIKHVLLGKPSCTVNIIMDSLIPRDSLTCIQISSGNSNYKIIDAYVRCKGKERLYNDTIKRIEDCGESLVIENDTVKIYTGYSKPGSFNFEIITILLSDKKSKFYYIDTSFIAHVK